MPAHCIRKISHPDPASRSAQIPRHCGRAPGAKTVPVHSRGCRADPPAHRPSRTRPARKKKTLKQKRLSVRRAEKTSDRDRKKSFRGRCRLAGPAPWRKVRTRQQPTQWGAGANRDEPYGSPRPSQTAACVSPRTTPTARSRSAKIIGRRAERKKGRRKIYIRKKSHLARRNRGTPENTPEHCAKTSNGRWVWASTNAQR